jgi:hypothetical protein
MMSVSPCRRAVSLGQRRKPVRLEPANEGGFIAIDQGLTLVQFSAELERFLWDRGCA